MRVGIRAGKIVELNGTPPMPPFGFVADKGLLEYTHPFFRDASPFSSKITDILRSFIHTLQIRQA